MKEVHTYRVVDLMEKLAFQLGYNEEERILAKIIGLLHDIGRFEQIKQFHVISDIKTNTDHAKEAVHYLFEEGHIRDFVLEEKYDLIIKEAILNHNKLKIDPVSKEALPFVKMIRDMDKVDIFRVLAVEFEMEFDAKQVTPKVLKDFRNKKLVKIKDVVSPSDETLLHISFVFDINFNESYDILAATDNFELFLGTVQVNDSSEKEWNEIKKISIDQINEGTGE